MRAIAARRGYRAGLAVLALAGVVFPTVFFAPEASANGVPVVTVDTPAGGEVWTAGSTQTIAYTVADDDELLVVDMEYLVDGVPTTILANWILSPGPHTFAWAVPARDLPGVTIRVCAEDGWTTVCGLSGSFAIDGRAPALQARSPTGTNVPPGERIVVEFSEPMDPDRVGSALSVFPPPGGISVSPLNETAFVVDHAPFAPGEEYRVQVSCDAEDESDPGHALSPCPASWRFLVASPPTIGLAVPKGGESWTGGSTHVIRWIATDAEDPVADLRVYLEVSLDGLTYEPISGSLAGDATFPWTVPAGDTTGVRIRARVVDTRDLSAEGVSSAFRIDATPPAVTGTSPADGAVDVEWQAPIRVTFGEPMNATAAAVAFSIRTAEGALVPGTVTWDSPNVLRFQPDTPLRASTTYRVQVDRTATDASDPGNPLASATSWSFTTRSNTGPSIALQAAMPAIVSGGSVWTVTWTAADPEDPSDALQVFVEFSDGGPFRVVGGPFPGAGTFAWPAPLQDVRLAALRVRVVDSQGQEAVDVVSFAIDATPPTVLSASPPPDDANASADAPITITFSERMAATDGASLRETASGRWIPVALVWADPWTLQLEPSEPLREDAEYEVFANATLRDASSPGNPLAAIAWRFRTTWMPPALAVVAPDRGARWTAGVPHTILVDAADSRDPEVVISADLAADGATFEPLLAPTVRPNGLSAFPVVPPRVDAEAAVLRVCAADLSGVTACATIPLVLDATPPRVVAKTPPDGALQVHPEAPLVLTFSESMDRASVEAALSLSPPSPLTLRWARTRVDDDTVIVDHPSLIELRPYTARLDCVARDASVPGLPLHGACPTLWTFTTAASPDVRLLFPLGGERLTGGAVHTVEWIAADEEAMLQARLELSLDGGVTFPLRLADYGASPAGLVRVDLTLPAVDAANAVLRVTLTDSLGLTAEVRTAPFVLDATPPALASASPEDGATEVSPLADLVLAFSEPIDPTSLAGALTVTPALRDPVIAWSATMDAVRISHAAVRLGKTVTVSLNGLRDASRPGNALHTTLAFAIEPDREKPRPALAVEPEARLGDVVVLDATGSWDNDEIVAYEWTIRDAGSLTVASLQGARVEYRVSEPGVFNVTLDVLDAAGNVARASTTLYVRAIETALPSVWDWLALLGSAGATAYGLTDRARSYFSRVVLLPLYVRTKGPAVLDQETRGMIRGYILVNPGDCYTDIKRNLRLANGELAYHLRVLEREGLIQSATKGARRVYYPADVPIPEDEAGLHEIQARTIHHIGAFPGLTVRELAVALGVSSQLALYHVRKLAEMGYVRYERRGMRIRVSPTNAAEGTPPGGPPEST